MYWAVWNIRDHKKKRLQDYIYRYAYVRQRLQLLKAKRHGNCLQGEPFTSRRAKTRRPCWLHTRTITTSPLGAPLAPFFVTKIESPRIIFFLSFFYLCTADLIETRRRSKSGLQENWSWTIIPYCAADRSFSRDRTSRKKRFLIRYMFHCWPCHNRKIPEHSTERTPGMSIRTFWFAFTERAAQKKTTEKNKKKFVGNNVSMNVLFAKKSYHKAFARLSEAVGGRTPAVAAERGWQCRIHTELVCDQ